MSEQAPNLIEFHAEAASPEFPQPQPATRAIPEWLKTMPPEVPGNVLNVDKLGTVKSCPPFVEAMSCGYVLPVICDVHFFMRPDGQLECQQAMNVIESHPPIQYAGSPFADKFVVKFANPWIVRTPPGYSTLFMPLLNHFSLPFQFLAGMVETDRFYRPAFFPSFCMMSPGQRFTLRRGAPIVQAIPIKRESWQSSIGIADLTKTCEDIDALKANPHHYKDKAWVRKSYH